MDKELERRSWEDFALLARKRDTILGDRIQSSLSRAVFVVYRQFSLYISLVFGMAMGFIIGVVA